MQNFAQAQGTLPQAQCFTVGWRLLQHVPKPLARAFFLLIPHEPLTCTPHWRGSSLRPRAVLHHPWHPQDPTSATYSSQPGAGPSRRCVPPRNAGRGRGTHAAARASRSRVCARACSCSRRGRGGRRAPCRGPKRLSHTSCSSCGPFSLCVLAIPKCAKAWCVCVCVARKPCAPGGAGPRVHGGRSARATVARGASLPLQSSSALYSSFLGSLVPPVIPLLCCPVFCGRRDQRLPWRFWFTPSSRALDI